MWVFLSANEAAPFATIRASYLCMERGDENTGHIVTHIWT